MRDGVLATCWKCNEPFWVDISQPTYVEDDDDVSHPQEGDWTLCEHCGELHVFLASPVDFIVRVSKPPPDHWNQTTDEMRQFLLSRQEQLRRRTPPT